jgi:hypothetical protein
MAVIQFYKGESVLFSVEVRDQISNLLTDPTSMAITIVKPSTTTTGTSVVKVNEQPMAKSSVGKYTFSWLSDEAGAYSVIYKANNNSNITISKDSFSVIN